MLSQTGFTSPPPRSKRLSVRVLDSVADLRLCAAAWNDLWARSNISTPRARAELVALAVEQFSPLACFRAVIVEEEGVPVAALPLVEQRRFKGAIRTAGQFVNDFIVCGDLLLDLSCDVERVSDLLVAECLKLRWPLLWFDWIPIAAPRWQAFQRALRRAGVPMDITTSVQIAQVRIDGDWDAYFATRSSNHRHACRRQQRQLQRAGTATFSVHRPTEGAEADALLKAGWFVEDRSWKGPAGTSVLRAEGMASYFSREARMLADWGMLELAFLELDGQPIAFHYAWNAKRTHFVPKVGYDAAYARFSPGQQLMMHVLRQLHTESRHNVLDFHGPLADWTSKWSTGSYPIGRIIVGGPSAIGRRGVQVYAHSRNVARSLRDHIRSIRGARR